MARRFNGSSDFIDLGTVDFTFAGSSDQTATIYVQVQPNSVTSGSVFSHEFGSPSMLLLIRFTSTIIQGFTSGGGFNSSVTPVAGGWYSIVFSIGGFLQSSFISVNNTVTTGAAGSAQFPNNGAFPANIGRRTIVLDWFSGLIADVAIWNTNLTQGEALALNRGAPPGRIRPGNLRLWSQLDGDRSPEPDASGWGHVGIVNGTTKAVNPPYETFVRSPRRVFGGAAAPAAVFTGVGQTIFKLRPRGWAW
jgi:hypothetical protein